jgi:hypothetical protein
MRMRAKENDPSRCAPQVRATNGLERFQSGAKKRANATIDRRATDQQLQVSAI